MSPQQKRKESTNNEDNNDVASVLTATPDMCHFCFDTLIDALQYNRAPQLFQSPDVADVSVQCPLFVTWETYNPRSSSSKQQQRQWQLRGCIGTLSPKLLVTAIGEYALMAALKDRRFQPIVLGELPNMRVAVSLLVNYQVCEHAYDWEIGVHGILIKFEVHSRHYNATYLPEVAKEQGWNQSQAVASLIQKAGFQGSVTPELLRSIHCTRYESSKHRVEFEHYKMTRSDLDILEQPQASSCTNM